jgi:Tol biopolymer transport system component
LFPSFILFIAISGCVDSGGGTPNSQASDRPIVYTWFHTRQNGYRAEMILTVKQDGSRLDTVFVGGDNTVDGAADPPGLGARVPAWSPDGKWIAFEGYWATPADSTNERETRRGRVRRASHRQIFIIRRDGSGLRQLTDDAYMNSSPDWSPDGSQIVYTSEREDGTDLFVVDTTGSEVRRLTNHPGNDGGADWSPDGKHLVFTSHRAEGHGIYVMDADGSNVSWLAAAIKPTWSPSGNRIAFHARACAMIDPMALDDDDRCRATGTYGVKGNQALWLIDPDGSNLKRVWPPDGGFAVVRSADGRYWSGLGEYPLYPVWSPDGTHLAFHGPRPFYATDPDLQTRVDRLVLADSVYREAAGDMTEEEYEWLYANTFEREVSIFVVDTTGLDAREVTFPGDGGGHPEWH